MTIWTNELLDELEKIGDPELDTGATFARSVGRSRRPTAKAAAHMLVSRDAASAHATGSPNSIWFDDPPSLATSDHVERSYRLFATDGGEISAALLLASLPHAYAAESGAEMLAETKRLVKDARRRIGLTAQLLIDVLLPDNGAPLYPPPAGLSGVPQGLSPGGRGYVTATSTRLVHQLVRTHFGTSAGPVRINQVDLLGTLCTFTVTVFDVMDKLGNSWHADDQHAYLATWDHVGALLGIGTKRVVGRLSPAEQALLPASHREHLRPQTVAEARDLAELIADRQWKKTDSPFHNTHGKLLVRSLLDELQNAMPGPLERVPLAVMRYLVDDRVADLLGLGQTPITEELRAVPFATRLTSGRGRAGAGPLAATMRVAANEVSRRAFIHFMNGSLERTTPVTAGAALRFPGFTSV